MLFKNKFYFTLFLCAWAAIVFINPLSSHANEENEHTESEVGFYYTVQKKDTLWDISEKFFDSAWEWPNLWSENKKILNPHLIYPGQRLRLFRKRDTLEFEQVQETLDLGKVQKADIDFKYLERKIELRKPKKKPDYFYYPEIDKIGFIKEINSKRLHRGIIIKAKDDKTLLGTDDIIYLAQIGNIPFIPGDEYTAYKILYPKNYTKYSSNIGIQYYKTGIIKIIEKSEDNNIYMAKIIQTYREIEINNYVMPYKPKSKEIPLTKSKTGLEGLIVVAEEYGSIIGTDFIAFIDKGKNDVKPGQYYSIYYQDKKILNPQDGKYYQLAPVDLGSLIVLHTEQKYSTVLITETRKSISPGEKIHAPGKIDKSLTWP
jgi:hypothetical protein